MPIRLYRRLLTLILLAFIALLVVSCSGQEANGPESAPSGATATVQPTAIATNTPTAAAQAPTAAPVTAVAEIAVGAVAPDFTLSDLTGAQRSLSAYRGKVVMLNFWASWCGHCQSEIPALKAVYKDYSDKGFEIVAVSVGEEPAGLATFVQQNEMAFTVLADPQTSMVPLYQLRSVPTSYFLDQQGVVQQVYNGAIEEETLRGIVDQLLAE
jgi:peroxiredoxin